MLNRSIDQPGVRRTVGEGRGGWRKTPDPSCIRVTYPSNRGPVNSTTNSSLHANQLRKDIDKFTPRTLIYKKKRINASKNKGNRQIYGNKQKFQELRASERKPPCLCHIFSYLVANGVCLTASRDRDGRWSRMSREYCVEQDS